MTTSGRERNLLGEFLKARRGQVAPEDAGIPVAGRRPSPQILDALARALQLDSDGAAHLHALATGPSVPAVSGAVAPEIQRLLDGWAGAAAFVRDRRFDVLASNALARALSPFYVPGRNLVRDTFLDPSARTFFADWDTIAAQAVAGLRQEAGALAGDPAVTALIAELSAEADFSALWARHDVRAVRGEAKRFVHPVAGSLTLSRQVLSVPDTDGHVILAYLAEPGSTSEAALASLLPAGR